VDTTHNADRENKASSHNFENDNANSATANDKWTIFESNKPDDNNKETDHKTNDNNKENNDNDNEENNNNEANNNSRKSWWLRILRRLKWNN
jgi:hypothetical protein